MGKLKLLLFVIAVVAVMLVGRVFFPIPRPEVVIAPEAIFTVAGFTVTNTILTGWVVLITLAVLSWLATRNMKEVPSGLQNLFEAGLEAFLSLVERVAGEKNARLFFPIVSSILLYVLVSNWFGLLPTFGTVGRVIDEEHGYVLSSVGGITFIQPGAGEIHSGDSYVLPDGAVVTGHAEETTAESDGHGEAAAPTHGETEAEEADLIHLVEGEKVGIIHPFFRSVNTDLNATLAIAIVAVLFVQIWGFRTLGLRGYGSKFINIGKLKKGDFVMGGIDVFVGLLEAISEFARMISFTFRLFGNIFAGEVLFLIITFLMPWLLILPFYGLELFVGFIQAFVFAMLTLVFGAMAVTGHGDHAEHGEQGREAAGSTH